MNIQAPRFLSRLFGGLHRSIQAVISTLFLGAVVYISCALWVNSISPFRILDLLILPFMDGPPTLEREFEEDADPVVFSQRLQRSQSTVAESLTERQRMRRMVRSVVHISVNMGNGRGALGSGVILDNRRCLVVTNAHVIDQDGSIVVRMVEAVLNNGEEVTREVAAVVVGRPSAREDLALLQLAECRGMPWAYWMALDTPGRGDKTIAIGHPNSQTWSSTEGTVSHPARFWRFYTTTGFGLIQTDAAINPGNSGGALFAPSGELVGINSMILKRSNNLGYARSALALNNYINHLRHHGEMADRELHLDVRLWRSLKGHFGIEVIATLPELNMVEGELKSGDIIAGANGARLLTMNSLRRALWADIDGQLELAVIRGDELVMVTVQVTDATPAT